MEKMAHLFSFKIPRVSWVNLWILGILLVAAFLRLYRISDYMTFLGDEGRDALVVYGILHGKFTLLGPTASVGGFFLGPVYYYFMAPFLWLFNYDPVGAAVMVALFGVATVYIVYKVGAEFFNRTTGLSAAFLYAISPLVIAYSRSSWNPNLMPFFSLLALYVLYKAVVKKSAFLFVLCGFLLGIAMQLHYLTLFLGVVVAFYVFLVRVITGVNRVRRILKDYLLIALGFILGWLPFFAFEIRHGFTNMQSIIKFILSSGDTGTNPQFLASLQNVFFRLFGRLVTTFPPPEQISLHEKLEIALWYYGTSIIAYLGLFILIFKFFNAIKRKSVLELQKMGLILLWISIGVFLFGFYKKPIYDYYFGFMFPLPFLLVGVAFSKVFRGQHELKRIEHTGKTLALAFFLVIVWLNFQGIPFRFTPNRQKDQVRQISEFVLSKADEKPFNFALITLKNSDHGYRYFFKLAGKDPVIIETFRNDPERKTVTNQLLIVCEDPDCKPLGHPLWEVAGFGRAEITGEWQVSVVKVYKLVHYKGK